METAPKTAARSGWKSSKFHLGLISMALVTAVFLFVVHATSSAAGFGEYCITIVSLVASTQGSRVAESFAALRRPAAAKEG